MYLFAAKVWSVPVCVCVYVLCVACWVYTSAHGHSLCICMCMCIYILYIYIYIYIYMNIKTYMHTSVGAACSSVIRLRNAGNLPATILIRAEGHAGLESLSVKPPCIHLAPNSQAPVKVTVRTWVHHTYVLYIHTHTYHTCTIHNTHHTYVLCIHTHTHTSYLCGNWLQSYLCAIHTHISYL